MLKKLKNVKTAREFIGFVLLMILYAFHPNMIEWNYVIFLSAMFVTTIDTPTASKEKSVLSKLLATPSILFISVTLLMIVGVLKNPLSIEMVVALASLAGVKGVKNIASNIGVFKNIKAKDVAVDKLSSGSK